MICTGNEYIAIPEIEENSDVLSINVLSMAQRGMIEFREVRSPSFTSDSLLTELLQNSHHSPRTVTGSRPSLQKPLPIALIIRYFPRKTKKKASYR